MDLLSIEKESRCYERFLTKVEVLDNGCWQFNGWKDRDGYGIYNRYRKTKRAHRLSYEWHIGRIPAGFAIDHLCKKKDCVNPAHLEPVTFSENSKREGGLGFKRWFNSLDEEGRKKYALQSKKASEVAAKKLLAKTTCKRGHPWAPETTYINPKGDRRCQVCFNNNRRLKNKE